MTTTNSHPNPYLGILVLISLTKVSSDRCPFDEIQVFPSPPEFPDFMTAFQGTILRIGLTNLLPNDGSTLSNACPESVNWSEFNSRLCGKDPFDLEGFCNPITTTAEPTVASLTTPQMTVSRSISIGTTTETSRDLGNDTTSSMVNLTNPYPVSNHTNDTGSTSPRTSQSPNLTDSDDSDFKDRSSKDVTKSIDSEETPILPSDVYAINGSKGVAAALYQGGGASIAIGVGCGLTLLCFLIIVVIIVLSHQTRGCGCSRLMNPLFKVFQRQTSDVRPLTWSLSNQPSTPLEEIRPNGEILRNINESPLKTDQHRIRNE